MKRVLAVAALALGMGVTFSAARADTQVYNTISSTNHHIDQQEGYNYYYIGDVITPSQTGTLTTIQIPFLISGPYQQTVAPFDYTANVQLDIYPTVADAVNNTNLLGTASDSSVFHDDGQIPAGQDYNQEDQQLLTFNYTSQNITLPSSFVIAYHDNGSGYGADSFSVVDQDGVGGQAFATYPDSATGDAYTDAIPEVGRSLQAIVNIATVPLPSAAWGGMALLGCLVVAGKFGRSTGKQV